jgi:hypothetical protein
MRGSRGAALRRAAGALARAEQRAFSLASGIRMARERRVDIHRENSPIMAKTSLA